MKYNQIVEVRKIASHHVFCYLLGKNYYLIQLLENLNVFVRGMSHKCRSLKSTPFRKVTHCIFDMDGTILDSELIYHQLIQKFCGKYHKEYTKELQERLYGGTDHDVCTSVVEELELPTTAFEMEQELHVMCMRAAPSIPFKRGAERLLLHLHHNNIPFALATNSSIQAIRLHDASRPKIFKLFSHKVSAEDPEVHHGKPHPDIFLVAASRFKDKPKSRQCLVFEDSVIGMEAAHEAGMQVVMTPERPLSHEATKHATLVLRSLLEFKPVLFGLPPFPETHRNFHSVKDIPCQDKSVS